MPAPLVSPGPQLPQTNVPVQVLVPSKDIFVTPALQRFTGSIPAGAGVIPIEGGHWVVTSHPDVVARLTGRFGYAMRRISPSMIRLFARLDIRQT